MAPKKPTIASGAFLKLFATAEQLGLTPAQVIGDLDFDVKSCDADARFPVDTLNALWESLQSQTKRVDATLINAQRYKPGDYGLVGFVAMNAPTLGDALRQVVLSQSLDR